MDDPLALNSLCLCSEKLTFLKYFALGMTLKLKKFSKKVIKIVWGPFGPNMATNEPSLTFGFVSFYK